MDAPLYAERVALQAAVAGRYEVEREIGRGGMGIVYRARDLALERPVAIKLLPPELAAQRELRERFLREARTAAGLAHPHVVPIHLVEAHDGVVFFVMGYVDGETLTARVRRAGALPPLEVARLLREVAWALGYAHGRGIVHRDIKPDNIMVEHATARAYVTDFGIARRTDGGAAALTAAGIVLGTAQFMSPEQAAGETVDGRSDIYALGIVGYFALTGRLPFDAPTVQATLAMQLTQRPPSLASVRGDLPHRLVDVVERCLAKQPAARFVSAEQLAEALDAVATPSLELAPILRNWIRVAEQWQIVLWTLGPITFALMVLAPQLAWVVAALFMTGLSGFTVDLVTRTRLLLRQGFSYDDVRAAIWIEREARLRELRSLLGDAAGRRRLIRQWTGVAGAGLAGLLAVKIAQRRVPGVPHALLVVAAVASITVFLLGVIIALTSSTRLQRTNTLFYTAVWRRWFGRWFFRIVGRGVAPVLEGGGHPGNT